MASCDNYWASEGQVADFSERVFAFTDIDSGQVADYVPTRFAPLLTSDGDAVVSLRWQDGSGTGVGEYHTLRMLATQRCSLSRDHVVNDSVCEDHARRISTLCRARLSMFDLPGSPVGMVPPGPKVRFLSGHGDQGDGAILHHGLRRQLSRHHVQSRGAWAANQARRSFLLWMLGARRQLLSG